MSLKLHFLDSHLDFFPQNLGEFSNEHSERFHQDISIMEKWFMGRWNCGIPAEYCWSIVTENPQGGYERKRSRKPF
jgi:hypothetical protein